MRLGSGERLFAVSLPHARSYRHAEGQGQGQRCVQPSGPPAGSLEAVLTTPSPHPRLLPLAGATPADDDTKLKVANQLKVRRLLISLSTPSSNPLAPVSGGAPRAIVAPPGSYRLQGFEARPMPRVWTIESIEAAHRSARSGSTALADPSLPARSCGTSSARRRPSRTRRSRSSRRALASTSSPRSTLKTRLGPAGTSGESPLRSLLLLLLVDSFERALLLSLRAEAYFFVFVCRWMVRNGMMGCFQENAFSIPVSTCAAPIYKVIKSQHGYQCVPPSPRPSPRLAPLAGVVLCEVPRRVQEPSDGSTRQELRPPRAQAGRSRTRR